MKAAIKQVEEINRIKEALNKTDSPYLKRDYTKNLRTLQRELKEYCTYRGLDYNEIISR